MNYIITKSYLLEDLQSILLKNGYSVLVENYSNDKFKVTFVGGNENEKNRKLG